MLVDNPLQSSYFATGSSSSTFSEYPTDLSDIFDTDLFTSTFAMGGSALSASPSGSRGSSPQNLMTPPQDPLPTSFPEVHDADNNHSLFSIYEEEYKSMDTLSMPTSSDFMNLASFDGSFGGSVGGFGMDMGGFSMGMDMSAMSVNPNLVEDPMQTQGIDPQLVDTPSAVSDHGEDDTDSKDESQSPTSPEEEKKVESEKPTITIAPVKVGGHGKARKGTVQSGGVVKKTAVSVANKDKENASFVAVSVSSQKKAPSPKATNPIISSSIFTTTASTPTSSKAESEAGDDDDDLPHDWRPSPEVFAKMTSKEKRQLRNKISARNFRVRRKEYISTLEGDIAERDRMLDHFRTQLGSQESENLALRQEIAALKKALLEGRGGSVHLPPPAPLPEQSAAETLAAAASSSTQSVPTTSSPLLTANTQKDLPSSPRLGGRFWGGVGMGGGFTPVHTTLVPDISTVVRKGLQENMNPALNAHVGLGAASNGIAPNKALPGFDGFADLNPFTMKTLDAYRMHLWGKMAQQQQQHNTQQHQQQHGVQPHSGAGLAAGLRPHYFQPGSFKPGASTLSALLSGKHSSAAAAYPSPPASPLLAPKAMPSSSREQQQQREKEQQHALLAAMASQTVFRKLGSAFWDAFSGSSSSSSSRSASAPHGPGNWDQDKVQRVLEGKAVLRVVDVEPATPKPRAAAVATSARVQDEGSSSGKKGCGGCVADILEESMRSLSLGKK
ncbi:hypothetical protein BDN70DRAFT_902719 [Pholiota conissans]|uniref:BZIP domain-containing protein n=1 Tax=Pholiota conissans TaxID=109636 RepID=A0A9P5ZGJ7_9AGAR|nr:hypothetical protein BDN70DRAFT_902719 [Pholiota conissans]